MTYKSKSQIEKKLKQVNFLKKEIDKFKGRIFVNDGIDPETGAHLLITHVSSFLAHARSIIQYAYKEAKKADESEKLNAYEGYIKNVFIFKIFKDIRDSDIHEYTIGCHQTINVKAIFNTASIEANVLKSKPIKFPVESLDDINKPKNYSPNVNVEYSLCKRVIVTAALLKELQEQGKQDLLTAIYEGKELYEPLEFDGKSDLHILCDLYVEALNKFIEHGIEKGFIS